MKNLKIFILIFSITLLTSCTTSDGINTRASIGNKNATVVIDEFSDFECPACGVISPQLEDIARKNSDKVLLNFYHFPLSYHQSAFIAAEAAECALDQNKFWEMGKVMFTNQRMLTEDNLKTFAKNLKLDTAKFNKCLDSGQKKAKIKSDIAEGNSRNLGYTPSIYVNKQLIQWVSAGEFEKYIKGLVK